jgi:uncharacterized membrane protein YkoI
LIIAIAAGAAGPGPAAAMDGANEPNAPLHAENGEIQGEPAKAPNFDALLLKIRADYPNARILKVELTREDAAGEGGLAYRVKLFPPNGRIQRLMFNARTLEPLSNVKTDANLQGGARQ